MATLKSGNRVIVTKDLDFEPLTTVRAGERGRVVNSDGVEVDIRLDSYHPGLTEYGNQIWATEDDGGVVLASLKRDRTWWIKPAAKRVFLTAGVLLAAYVLFDPAATPKRAEATKWEGLVQVEGVKYQMVFSREHPDGVWILDEVSDPPDADLDEPPTRVKRASKAASAREHVQKKKRKRYRVVFVDKRHDYRGH